jgi:hypothetical protein
MIKGLVNIDELVIKSTLFFIYLMSQNGNSVLLIFPSEYFAERYLAYGLLGSLLFTGFTFWWAFDSIDKSIELPVKRQIYKILLRTFLGTTMTFILLGLIKANLPTIQENTLLTVGIMLGFGFEYYAKRSFINSIFKGLGQKILDFIKENEEKK